MTYTAQCGIIYLSKGKGKEKMKKIVEVNIFFELEKEKDESIYPKAWKYIEDNLSDVFSFEGSELTIYNLNGEEYFESEDEEE